MIKIPLLGIETNVSDDATEQEIIEAVSEASVAFCVATASEGRSILAELKNVRKDDELLNFFDFSDDYKKGFKKCLDLLEEINKSKTLKLWKNLI